MSMPLAFQIGQTEPVRIKGEPATLCWRDAKHLVVDGERIHPILDVQTDDKARHFICGEPDRPEGSQSVTVGRMPGGAVFTMHEELAPGGVMTTALLIDGPRRED